MCAASMSARSVPTGLVSLENLDRRTLFLAWITHDRHCERKLLLLLCDSRVIGNLRNFGLC
jgi:hypothetical protein